VEPRLTSRLDVFWIDSFVVDVRKRATQARDLVHQPILSIGHQFAVALIPQLVTTRCASVPGTRLLLASTVCSATRFTSSGQFPMPEYDLHSLPSIAVSH